jgi:hypothetical protein
MSNMKSYVLLAAVSAIFLTLLAVPASAQATRTWVSGVGDDANPCSRTAPCKTFAGAISKTAASGEINCLDPAGFGAVTITKAITILCEPVSNGGVLVGGTNGITISAGANDRVVLKGLDFEGLAPTASAGLNGIQINSALEVIIIDCIIRNFTKNGVNMTSSVANSVTFIQNSFIANNGTSGTANTGGVNVQGSGGVANILALNKTEGNANYSAQVTGSANTLTMTRSYFGTNLSILSSGSVLSFGPSSVLPGNSPGPTQTFPFK